MFYLDEMTMTIRQKRRKRLAIAAIIIAFLIMAGFASCSIWLGAKLAEAGERPDTHGTTLLDIGECHVFPKGDKMCVIDEKESKVYLFQFYDYNGDDKCDLVLIFKKMIDPTWGTFYQFDGADTDCKKFDDIDAWLKQKLLT